MQLDTRNVPDDDLIKDLVTVAKKLNKNSVTMAEYNQEGKYNSATYHRRFSSWTNALEKAGLQETKIHNIPEEDLFRNIEEVWTKLGRQPRYEEVKKPLSKYHAATYGRRFGNWGKALEKFVAYINADELNEEESANHSPNKVNSVDDTLVKNFKHKTKRDISERLRFRILMRDGFTCKKCGRSPVKEMGVELHVDHIIPWSKGGETLPENLETKCSRCNLGKGNAFNE